MSGIAGQKETLLLEVCCRGDTKGASSGNAIELLCHKAVNNFAEVTESSAVPWDGPWHLSGCIYVPVADLLFLSGHFRFVLLSFASGGWWYDF